MDYGIILALGALILAFIMGVVTGAVLTISILVRHTQRKLRDKGIGPLPQPINPGLTSMIIDEAASSVLDRKPS